MSGIELSKQDNTWQVVTKNGTYTVTDANGNGQIDNKDVWTAANGDALPTTDEKFEAMGLSLKKENMTGEEIDKYNKFLKIQEAKEAQQAKVSQYEEQQRQQQLQQALYGNNTYTGAQPSKKKNFWSKLGMGMMIGMTAFSAVSPLIFRPWQTNGNNFNDLQGNLFTGMTNLMSGMTGIMMMKYANSANSFNPSNYGNYNGQPAGGGNFNNLTQATQQYMQQQQQQMEEFMKQSEEADAANKQKQLEAQEQKRKAYIAGGIEKAYTDSKKEDVPMADANRKFLDEIYQPDKEEYSEEEVKNVGLIAKYQNIPYQGITETDEKGKMNTKLAQSLNDIIKKYERDEEGNKLKESDYKYIKNYILNRQAKNGALTEENLDYIRKIIKQCK